MDSAHATNLTWRKRVSIPARLFGVPVLLLATFAASLLLSHHQSWLVAGNLPPQAAGSSSPADRVVAYYFHATVRCVTCRTIESYSREAVEQAFAKELKDGKLEWKLVNIQLPENRHFIREYQLYTRSLVIVKVRGGKQVEWRNLEKVWELLGDKAEFLRYVQANVKGYLGAS